jgi:molecular chaperone DnaJ
VAQDTDLYAVLGVSKDAGQDEIKKAYRRLARDLHPDVNPDPETQERFKEVTAAYEILSDPEKRQRYDAGPDAFGGGFGSFGDIFEAFFGGGMGGMGGMGSRGPRTRAQRGPDVLERITLDLDEAAFGVTREVSFDTAVTCGTCQGQGTASGTFPETCGTCQGRGEVSQVARSFLGQVMTTRPCPRCGGVGSVITHPCASCGGDGITAAHKTVTVEVPAGVSNGTRIRLTGRGPAGPGGGPAGDLYVEIRERDHDVFERDGDDLHCKVSLPMTAAALGTTLTLTTLDGQETLDIKPGTQSGHVIPLRARGVPHLRSSGRGDLYVHVEVRTPTHLDAEQERLLRDLARLRKEEHPDGTAGSGGLFGRLRDVLGR